MPTIHDERPKLERLKAELEQGGAMETTMRGAVEITAQSVDEQGLSWIEVMPVADKAKNGRWLFTITADDLSAAAEFIRVNPDRIPIDYDHAGAEGGSTKAAGWFTGNAEVREESLWAEVKWTPAAVQEIRDGSFRFISPEWNMQHRDKETGLLTKFKELAAATLTNRPFFSGMAPVTAVRELAAAGVLSDADAELLLKAIQVKQDDETIQQAVLLKDAGGDPSATDQGTADDDQQEAVVAENENGVTDYMKMLGLDETVDPKHRLAAAFREKDETIVALQQQVTELTADRGAKETEATELAGRLEDLEKKDRQRDIEVILARAVDKGRVFPAEKETLTELFANDVQGLKRMIATRPAEMFASLEPKGVGTGDIDRFADDPDVHQYEKRLRTGGDPIDSESTKVHLAAMQILKEQGKADNYTNDEYIAACKQASESLALVY